MLPVGAERLIERAIPPLRRKVSKRLRFPEMAAFFQKRPRFSPRLTIVQRIHRSIYTGAGATTKTSSELCGYNQSRRPPRRSRRQRRRLRIRRSTRRSAADFNARRWIPVTKLGRLVKEGRIRSNAVHKSNCHRKVIFGPKFTNLRTQVARRDLPSQHAY